MKKLIIAITVVSTFASCHSQSGDLKASTKKVRVQPLYKASDNMYYELNDPIAIKSVDTMYRVGDVIQLLEKTYRIIQ